MKRLFFVIVVAFFLSGYALADSNQTPVQSQIEASDSSPSEANLETHKHYINKDGKEIHSPAKSKNGEIPAGASAKCGDGTYSFSRHRQGTCSHHGGVAAWL